MSDSSRTFAKFTFFKVNPAWQRRDPDQRAQDKREFRAACDDFALERSLRAYSTVGTRGEVDLLLLTQAPALDERHVGKVPIAQRDQIERHERRRRLGRQPVDAGRGRVDALLQGVEVERITAGDDDLAVDDATRR